MAGAHVKIDIRVDTGVSLPDGEPLHPHYACPRDSGGANDSEVQVPGANIALRCDRS